MQSANKLFPSIWSSPHLRTSKPYHSLSTFKHRNTVPLLTATRSSPCPGMAPSSSIRATIPASPRLMAGCEGGVGNEESGRVAGWETGALS